MNVLISKLDIARFTECPDKMKTYGGFDVAALMLLNMVKEYPQHTFYYIGSNDISKFKDRPNNLIDIETPIKEMKKHYKDLEKYEVAINYCKENNLTFDIALYWYCRFTNLAKYKVEYMTTKGTPRKLRQCEKCLSHIMAVPQEFNIPVYYMIDDVTELKQIPYDMQKPAAIWTQCNGTTTYQHYTSTDNPVREKIPVQLTYKPIEKLWLLGKKKVDWRDYNKTNKFIVTCNAPSDQSLDKLFYIKKWVFDIFDDSIVYGRWECTKKMAEEINKYNYTDRFIHRGMCEMEDLMFNTKYTIVIPPSERYPEFVTQKAYSMLYYGIIPFWCKNDYDKDGIYTQFPDFIKIESPDELVEKINYLESNPEEYRKLLYELYEILEDKYFDNRIIHELFDEILGC